MKKLFIVLIAAGLLLFTAVVGTLLYFGAVSPETYVVTGRELAPHHRSTLVDMELLGEDEDVDYFYSDALFDIRESFMFVTQDRLVVYSEAWSEPLAVLSYEDILVLGADFEEEWYLDSLFFVEDRSGEEIAFPVSSERGRDRDVYELLESRCPNLERPDEPEPEGALDPEPLIEGYGGGEAR